MHSYLLSTLAAQARALGPGDFQRRFPEAWLLWEPGEWQPPKGATEPAVEPTLTPAAAGEPLAFGLEPEPDAEIVLGRGAACRLRVHDGTLSSRHLALRRDGAGWSVKDVGSKNGSLLEGAPLKAREWAALASGVRLTAGNVHFTFYLTPELLVRLASGPASGLD